MNQDTLPVFRENNPHASIRLEGDAITINEPWGSKNVALISEISDLEFLQELECVWLNPAFDAVIHLDTNTIEVLFLYLDPSDEIQSSHMNRNFSIHYDGNKFDCAFGEPSARFMAIARKAQNFPSDDPGRSVPQIAAFRDAQRLDELPDRAKRYFANMVPRNFHIQSSTCIKTVDMVGLMRHINFITDYYDRRFPEIVVRDDLANDKHGHSWMPMRYIDESELPAELSVGIIDEVVLQLISVARRAPTRQAFLYYYQVIEYAGHYFIDERVRSQIRRFLRDPALVSCDEKKIGEFLSLFATQAKQEDDARMKKVIEELVDPGLVWREIQHDRDFFTSSHVFDGGFEMKELISKDMSVDAWKSSWMPNLYDRLTKIRNALVHARERRENKVILPSRKNNQKIARLEPVIARVAQQIALGMLS
jgi:hypothetical protein